MKEADLADFVYDNTLDVSNKDLTKLLQTLQNECEIAIE